MNRQCFLFLIGILFASSTYAQFIDCMATMRLDENGKYVEWISERRSPNVTDARLELIASALEKLVSSEFYTSINGVVPSIISTQPAPEAWTEFVEGGFLRDNGNGSVDVFLLKNQLVWEQSTTGRRWISIATHRNACPKCLFLGLSSQVASGWCSETAMGFYPYYDEAGNYHSHDPNHVSCSGTCDRCHNFAYRPHPKTCPTHGCSWNNR